MPSMALLILRRNLHGRTSSLLQARLFSRSPESAAAVAPKRRTSEPKPIEKILAANRGEIACRIMRTAGRLGIGPSPSTATPTPALSTSGPPTRPSASAPLQLASATSVERPSSRPLFSPVLRCLEELAKIMECKAQKKLIVLLMFYKVEPREVRGKRSVWESYD